MKVLFVMPSLAGGGAERVLSTIINNLDQSIFQLSLAVINVDSQVYHIHNHVKVINLSCSRARYAFVKIIRLVWALRPDVLFCNAIHLNILMAFFKPLLPRETRLVARQTTMSAIFFEYEKLLYILKPLYKFFYKNFDCVICQSKSMREDLLNSCYYPEHKAVVIPNPVNSDYIQEQSQKPLPTASMFKKNKGKITFLAVGRLSQEKGFDLLLRAIAIVNRSDIHLTILGDGPLKHSLNRQVQALSIGENVTFAGFQANPYAWMSRAHACIFSSYLDAFPNVILEALACGTPVIAVPAIGGILEILTGVKECVLADAISAESLAMAINDWLKVPLKRIDPKSIEPYKLKHIIPQYEKILLARNT